MKRLLYRLLACACMMLLSACGFHLQSAVNLPFHKIYTNIDLNTEFGVNFYRYLKAVAPQIEFVKTPQEAQIQLIQLQVQRSKVASTINTQGQIEEYQLTLSYQFQLIGPRHIILIPRTTLQRNTYLAYNDNQQDSQVNEMDAIYQSMENHFISDIVSQISSPQVRQLYLTAHQQ